MRLVIRFGSPGGVLARGRSRVPGQLGRRDPSGRILGRGSEPVQYGPDR